MDFLMGLELIKNSRELVISRDLVFFFNLE